MNLKFPDMCHLIHSHVVVFSELLITKEGRYAVMLDLYGDLSHYVLGEILDFLHFMVQFVGLTVC